MGKMLVLGIESSCDETAAALVADGEYVLSNVVASQVLTHARFGGVVPELASREHLRKIGPVVDAACREAGVSVNNVDAVAVTEGPGLIGSLLVGLVYAKALALSLEKPLVGVNHLEGHVHAVLLENKMARRAGTPRQQVEEPSFPNVTLVVSGGHTSLFRVEKAVGSRQSADSRKQSAEGSRQEEPEGSIPNVGSSPAAANRLPSIADSQLLTADCRLPSADCQLFSYVRLGQTRDDAAGEAFDKVAKLLALGYPGGPVIDQLSRCGDFRAQDFGHIRMKGNPLDFSFSGLKTAVLYRVRGTELAREAEERRTWRKTVERPTLDDLRGHCSQATLDLVASFQHAVVTDLVERTLAAADREAVECIFVSGGVACNSLLRERFSEAAARARLQVFFPSLGLSTDNAAMIAAAGFYKLAAGARADSNLTAHASLPLG